MNFIYAVVITFIGCSIAVPLLLGICRALGLYAIVNERQAELLGLVTEDQRK